MEGAKVGSIYWEADLDNTKVVKGVKETSNVVKELGNTSNTATMSVGSLVKSLALAATAVTMIKTGLKLGQEGLQVAGNIESANQGFKTLLGSAEDAAAAIEMIKRDAAQTPFELPGLIKANQQLTQVTKNAQQSESILMNVGKALAAAGQGQEEMERIITNLQQIGNTGKITEMDVRQFGMSGINILELLADYYGVTKDEAADMVKNSKDAFTDLEAAFAKAGESGGKFANAFKDQAGTFNQSVSNMKDAFGIALSDIAVKTGLFDFVKKAILEITGMIQFYTPVIIAVVNTISSAVMSLGAIFSAIGRIVVGFFDALGHAATLDFKGTFKSIGDSANGVKGDFDKTLNSIKNMFTDNDKKIAFSNDNRNNRMAAGNAKLTSEQLKNIEKENEAFERSNKQKLKSFQQSLADMIWAHQDKVTKTKEDMADENKDFNQKMADRVKSNQRSLDEMVEAHSKKVDKIVSQLDREKVDTQKANDSLLADAKDEKDQETKDHGEKVVKLEKLIDHEVLLGKNGSKSKIKSLREQIDEENAVYEEKLAKIDKDSAKEVQSNNDKLTQKITDLNAELAEENASFAEQKTKLDQDNLDTTNKIKAEHADRLADYQKTLDEESAILRLHQADVDSVKNKAREDDITRLRRQFDEEAQLAAEDHARKIADIKNKGNEQGTTQINAINQGLQSGKEPIRLTFNSAIMDPMRDLTNSSGEAGKKTIGEYLKGIVSQVGSMASGTRDWFGKILGNDFFKNLPHFANGVSNFGGGLAMVGELGPELVQLPGGSSVHSNKDSKDMVGGSRGQNVNIYIDKVRDYQDVQAIGRELGVRAGMQPS